MLKLLLPAVMITALPCAAVPHITFSVAQGTVAEPNYGGSSAVVEVELNLSEPPQPDMSFEVEFSQGLRHGEADYWRDYQYSPGFDPLGTAPVYYDGLGTKGRIRFRPTIQTKLAMPISVHPDLMDEGPEAIRITFRNPAGCTLGQQSLSLTTVDAAPAMFVAVNSNSLRYTRPDGSVVLASIPGGGTAGGNYGLNPSIALYDVDYDNTPDLILGSDAVSGRESLAGIYTRKENGVEWQTEFRDELRPYPGFTGGCWVAAGRVAGGTSPCIVTGPRAGGGPHVRVTMLTPAWRDTVTVAGPISQTRYARDFVTTDAGSFFAYDAQMTSGVRVACGDVNGDGVDDIITVPGAGAPGHVKVFRGGDFAQILDYYPYGSFDGGMMLSAGDWNGDGKADILTSANAPGGSHIRLLNPVTMTYFQDFIAYDNAAPDGGVRAVILPRPAVLQPGGPVENRMLYTLHRYTSGGLIRCSLTAAEISAQTWQILSSPAGPMTWEMGAWLGYRPRPFSYALSPGGLLTVQGDPAAYYRLWYLPDLQFYGTDPVTGATHNWKPVEFFQPDRAGQWTRQLPMPYAGLPRGFFKVTCQNNYDWRNSLFLTTAGD